jgi:hypothetical protein
MTARVQLQKRKCREPEGAWRQDELAASRKVIVTVIVWTVREPRGRERPPLKAATKQRLVKTVTD